MVSLCLKALNEQQNPSSVFLNSKMEPHSSMFPCHQHFWINSVQFGITWKNYINFTFFSEFNFDRWFHVKSAKNDKNSFTSNKASDISLGVIHFVIGLISSKVSLTSGSLNLTTNSNSFWSVSKEDDSTASFHLLINLDSNFPAKISQNSLYYLRWFLSQGLKFLLYNFIWRTYRDCRKINFPNWVICGIQSC